ncbi:glutamate racemase [Candidatus Saccharibacteria bacterium RIFCSPLOWO2_02_FULL_46_7]|nr:MAG: glutamate racemase [Candidatus Saccharibacteria bacterium RIFCSPLOWO2_02_FULL_46_7]
MNNSISEYQDVGAGVQKIRIGVFDSGVGGLSIVKAIQKELPDLEIVFKDDTQHVPYGTRGVEEIYSFVKPFFQEFVDEGCKVIVIACNTVTTNLATRLRAEFSVPMVGMEPMVKPAAAVSKTGIIAVCATPRTLFSRRYKWLKEEFAKNVKVLEPDCSDWTYMIENNRVDREKIAKIVDDVCDAGADQIVLGCTHYHWIEQLIKDYAKNRAKVIQPESAVVAQLRRVLQQLL